MTNPVSREPSEARADQARADRLTTEERTATAEARIRELDEKLRRQNS